MLGRFLRYLKGYIELDITGDSTERFLNLCRNKQIYLRSLKPQEMGYRCYLDLSSFRKLKPLLKKTGTKVRIIGKYGLPFFFHRYRKRKTFLLGLILSFEILYFLSLHVWMIQIEGNIEITTETILEYLQEENIHTGMSKKEVLCDEIVKKIRKEYDQITWASASLDGSRLLVRIKEGIPLESATKKSDTKACDLVAESSGVIVKMITRSGIPMVSEGDIVEKGALLVSGSVPVLNDAKEVIGYQYKMADADIIACVEERYQDSLSLFYEKAIDTGKKRHLFYLRTKNRWFTFGITPKKYDKKIKTTKESNLKLYKDDFLSIAYGISEIREYETQNTRYTKEELKQKLSIRYQAYINEKEEAGMTVKDSDVTIKITDNQAIAEGKLKIWQDIGEQMPLKIDFQENPVVE